MAGNWIKLFARAERRGGVVTIADVRAAGIPMATFHLRVTREAWTRPCTGVYLLPGTSWSPVVRHHVALAALGDQAALSHATAAMLHGLGRHHHSTVHAVVPQGVNTLGPSWVQRHRSRVLDDSDVVLLDGLTVTNASRTLMDVAVDWSTDTVLAAILEARQRRLATSDELLWQLDRRRAAPGRRTFRLAVELAMNDGADSILERRTRELLFRHGLTPTDEPHPVPCADRVLHVDLAFPAAKVAIECDGYTAHASRRAFERDRDRWRQLREAGWSIVWATWSRVHDESEAFVDEVHAALRTAD